MLNTFPTPLAVCRRCSGRSRGRAFHVRASVSDYRSGQRLEEAERRWESQVRDGKIRSIDCGSAREAMKHGWTLLDVRPLTEVKRGQIIGAVEVPIYVPDSSLGLPSLLKRFSSFLMGGWWLGGTHMVPNKDFVRQVQARVPKDASVIVGCQKGLRSLAACEQLSRAGYEQLAWINGGFDTCMIGDLDVQGDTDLRYAGVGGLSAFIGWTEVHQQEDKDRAGGMSNILKLAAVLLILDAVLFAYGQVQVFLSVH